VRVSSACYESAELKPAKNDCRKLISEKEEKTVLCLDNIMFDLTVRSGRYEGMSCKNSPFYLFFLVLSSLFFGITENFSVSKFKLDVWMGQKLVFEVS